jgi:hypothetical protein
METANRNASGAGVKMSTVDGMPQDRWCSERMAENPANFHNLFDKTTEQT